MFPRPPPPPQGKVYFLYHNIESICFNLGNIQVQ